MHAVKMPRDTHTHVDFSARSAGYFNIQEARRGRDEVRRVWNTTKAETCDSKALTCVHNDVDQVHALGEGVPQVDVVEGHDASLPLGTFQGLPSLQCLFSSHLVLVKLRKIVYDDGNG